MALQSTSIKVEETLKRQAQQLFSELGLDLSSAINVFLRQAVLEHAIPFRIGYPAMNPETLDALQEVEMMKTDPASYKGYTDVDEMMRELLE